MSLCATTGAAELQSLRVTFSSDVNRCSSTEDNRIVSAIDDCNGKTVYQIHEYLLMAVQKAADCLTPPH